MIDERYIELMNNEIDGHNTPAQSDSLRSYLESDPEAQCLFSELQQSASLIAESEEVAPPTEMPRRIMDLVAESEARDPGDPASRAWRDNGDRARRRRFGTFLKPASAWAFAAGLTLGLLAFAAFELMWRGELSHDQLRGDMAVPARSGVEMHGSPWQVDGADFTGSVTARRTEDQFVLRIVGTAGADTRFILEHGGSSGGVAYRILSGPTGTLNSASGRTNLAFAGTGEHIVSLLGKEIVAAPLTVRIESPAGRLEHVFGPGPP